MSKGRISITTELRINRGPLLRASECPIAELRNLARAIHFWEAVMAKVPHPSRQQQPWIVPVYGTGWRRLISKNHPLWSSKVIYAFVADQHIRDVGATPGRNLRLRVAKSHERLRKLCERYPEWTLFAIPVINVDKDEVFHGDLLPRLEEQRISKHQRFTHDGYLEQWALRNFVPEERRCGYLDPDTRESEPPAGLLAQTAAAPLISWRADLSDLTSGWAIGAGHFIPGRESVGALQAVQVIRP